MGNKRKSKILNPDTYATLSLINDGKVTLVKDGLMTWSIKGANPVLVDHVMKRSLAKWGKRLDNVRKVELTGFGAKAMLAFQRDKRTSDLPGADCPGEHRALPDAIAACDTGDSE